MILKSIKLYNIRSYESQIIEFPLGLTLLSGDIGSGKSTILLAIEFALFGVKRHYLPGSTLLRHGKKEGSVELNFQLGDKNIIIQRRLKRGKNEISQESGYIIVNDIKKEASAVELKAGILNYLGYPKELVSKSKDLLFRYTVYTPQEQMKNIIFEDRDVRLDILRRVFNIDKYRRIRDNCLIITKKIRESIKEKIGMILDMEENKKHLKELKSELDTAQKKLEDIKPKYEFIKKSLSEQKTKLTLLEDDIKKLNAMKTELLKFETQLKHLIENRKKDNERIKRLELERDIIKKSIGLFKKEHDIKQIKDMIIEKEENLRKKEITIKELIGRFHQLKTNIGNVEKIKEKILSLNNCPTCEQVVNEDHKHFISLRQDKEKEMLSNEFQNITLQCEECEESIRKLKGEIKKLKIQESELKLYELKSENLNAKENELKELYSSQIQLKAEIGKINEKILIISKGIDLKKNIENEYLKGKTEFDIIQKKEKVIEIEKVKLDAEIKNITRNITIIKKVIEEKEKIKLSINRLTELKDWIDTFFISLMAVIEKHVMLQIQRQFNELFQNWFNLLLEDEAISVRIDDEFTPIAEQDGYEASIETLSGGEKTSIALSYRLALNKVINDIITTINTKDLIILDEPTDGFSTDQLDKVRDVLYQLNVKQCIIVSHESKIESYVDKVINIAKRDHLSVVSY